MVLEDRRPELDEARTLDVVRRCRGRGSGLIAEGVSSWVLTSEDEVVEPPVLVLFEEFDVSDPIRATLPGDLYLAPIDSESSPIDIPLSLARLSDRPPIPPPAPLPPLLLPRRLWLLLLLSSIPISPPLDEPGAGAENRNATKKTKHLFRSFPPSFLEPL